MRIVVTGRKGQLALSMLERGPALGVEVVALGQPELDLTAGEEALYQLLLAHRPEGIVNAAAYTAVDKAESEAELAHAVNAQGAGDIARVAQRLGVPLVHVSTDYVFAGDKAAAYVESDATGPTGAYGASKLAGEQAVLASGADAAILRTAWVYSPFGANFVKTMLRLAATRDELGVVADQFGCPTSALDLADACIGVLQHLQSNPAPELRGVFHATGQGEASWADFARAIFTASQHEGGPGATVKGIATSDYPTPARRPANSRLSGAKLSEIHGITLPQWQGSLTGVVARLVAESQAMAAAQGETTQ
jgi:dTDP-4-dehydrorhamnose reductase